ncbi:MAG: PilZ domain-containing protein [Chromatocurvus sp.]
MSGKNNRRFCRLPLESTVFIELESPPPGSIGPGKVVRCHTLEVSRWGLRVQIDQRVTVGAILQIGVDIPGNDEPFYLVGQVRWRMQEKDKPGTWIAGFEILNAAGSDLEHWEQALQVMEVREDS